jgi:hypothetical protein
MKYCKTIIASLSLGLFLDGCVNTFQPESNMAVNSKNISHLSGGIGIVNPNLDNDDGELYFADTKGKIFYNGDMNSKNMLEIQLNILLNNIFTKAKASKKLPRINRREKLNIAVEINNKSAKKSQILEIVQKWVLSNRRYNLTNIDRKSLEVLKKVLKTERDGLYTHRNFVKTKKASDVILYLSSSKKHNILTITIKLVSKNGTLIAITSKDINLNKSIKKEWIEVKVPRVDGPADVYEVMRFPVTKQQYDGHGSNVSIGNISYKEADRFCRETMKAELITPYVFEAARTSFALARPTSPIKSEMIAPFDEEDDEVYMINENDHLDGGDGTFISFEWNSEKYYAVSNMYKSPSMTFRCMKEK